MTPRLTSVLLAGSLIRRVYAEGGHAAVLAKGDETSGAILIVATEKGLVSGLWERHLEADGAYVWAKVGPQDNKNEEENSRYIMRRRDRDTDLWVIELDIPNAERFIVESTPTA